VHRLAHAHEDERSQSPATLNRRPAEVKELLDDFARVEVALQAVLRAGTEITAHGAAHLRGDATGGDPRA
jgi:hypothetical protein